VHGGGAPIVGITHGAEGSWFLAGEGEQFHQPAFPVEPVIDTTGCGNVFHGAFLFAALASAAAACNAGTLGGRGHLPTISEVERFLA